MIHDPRDLYLISQNVCPERWNAHFRAARRYQAYPCLLMEPLVLRRGSVLIDLEGQNMPKGYPVRVLFIDLIGPSPDAAGLTHCIVPMQEAVTK